MLKRAFAEANQWTLRVWYEKWPLWLAIAFLGELTVQISKAMLQGIEASQFHFIFAGLVSSTIDFFLVLLVPHVLTSLQTGKSPSLSSHFRRYFNQTAIESIRATARVFWFSYLLFIPGVIKLVRLTFVPYVVQFNTKYDAGKIDALKASETLTKGHFWFLAGTLMLCESIEAIEGVRSAFEWSSPWFAIAFVLTIPVRIYTQIVLFSVFKEYSREEKNELAI